jgi:hypothetical protein
MYSINLFKSNNRLLSCFGMDALQMGLAKYRMALHKRNARIENDALKMHVTALLREFGGLDLLSRVRVVCKDNDVLVEADDGALDLVHGALFFCGEYKSAKCKFELV